MISLIDLTNFCNDLGYELFPVRHGNKVRCIVFKDGRKIKEGDKLYKEWRECQRESFMLIYNKFKKV